jgi:hypothetical protein
MINAHVAYKKLVLKGMSEDLAEVVTELMDERQNDLATKTDIKLLKNDIDNLKENMATKADLANVKSELKEDMSKLKNSMDKIDISLNWTKALGIACLFLLIKTAFYN